jgi:hypothetical protein
MANNMEIKNPDEQIKLNGKIAKFPKNTKAVIALKFLETIKINPNKIWYIIVENQENELKLVKYNRTKGVDLLEYTLKLKEHYRIKYKGSNKLLEVIEKIEVIGEQDFSVIRNIPNVFVDESKKLTLLSKIMSDLIKLLAD